MVLKQEEKRKDIVSETFGQSEHFRRKEKLRGDSRGRSDSRSRSRRRNSRKRLGAPGAKCSDPGGVQGAEKVAFWRKPMQSIMLSQ